MGELDKAMCGSRGDPKTTGKDVNLPSEELDQKEKADLFGVQSFIGIVSQEGLDEVDGFWRSR